MQENEGEELCNCEVPLAYGDRILLNKTKPRLIRGQRYGIRGPKGVGKSTLMRTMANGQLEGFPPADELKTVFVEHNLQAEAADLSVLDFVLADPKMMEKKEEVEETLKSVGFNDERLSQAAGSLSGGWEMKLELARAALEHADILLLEEPTNYLDVTSVQWMVDYLTNLPNVTSMVVSHDSSFLDNVCTNIISYENRKLKTYRGNLSKFIEQRTEAKPYYALKSRKQLTGLNERIKESEGQVGAVYNAPAEVQTTTQVAIPTDRTAAGPPVSVAVPVLPHGAKRQHEEGEEGATHEHRAQDLKPSAATETSASSAIPSKNGSSEVEGGHAAPWHREICDSPLSCRSSSYYTARSESPLFFRSMSFLRV